MILEMTPDDQSSTTVGDVQQIENVDFKTVTSRNTRKLLRRAHRHVAPSQQSHGLGRTDKEAIETVPIKEKLSPPRFRNFRDFMHAHFPDWDYDEPGTILLFADVWDWPTLRFLKVAHCWSEMITFRDEAAPDIVSQPWFHAFHVEKRSILNVHKRNVTVLENPTEEYMDRLLSNLDIPYDVKPKLL